MSSLTRTLAMGLFALTILAAGCGDDEAIAPTMPVIATHPADITGALDGASVTFSVSATGGELTYLWELSTDDGAIWTSPPSGGTSAAYAVEDVGPADVGLMVRCEVSNVIGAVVSDVAQLANVFSGIVVFVDAGATGANNGLNWPNAFTDLQVGLAAAAADSEIWVADGSYFPTQGADRAATFYLVANVRLYGGFAGGEGARSRRDWDANPTILSGDIGAPADASDNSYHVVRGNSPARLNGFTITAGNANAAHPNDRGAGLYNDGASPRITNCTFLGNSATEFGGGMFAYFSSPKVVNCMFRGNTASFGGGIYLDIGVPTFTDCTFDGNAASSAGGGMYLVASNSIVTNCTFNGNAASSAGGGMYLSADNSIITNCTFNGNSAMLSGGGMKLSGEDAAISNCTFSGNLAILGGGGMDIELGNPTITNCTLSGNSAENTGGMSLSGNAAVTNCIIWGNAGALWRGAEIDVSGTTHTFSFSCIWDGLSGSGSSGAVIDGGGNIGDSPAHDPLFVNAPDFVDITTEAGTTTTMVVVVADNTFTVGDEIEVGLDGVPREVTAIDMTVVDVYGFDRDGLIITFANDPLSAASATKTHIRNWGVGATDLVVDLRLSAGSGCIDMGSNAAVPAGVTTDLDGNPRIVDGDNLDTDSSGDSDDAEVDMGAYEYVMP